MKIRYSQFTIPKCKTQVDVEPLRTDKNADKLINIRIINKNFFFKFLDLKSRAIKNYNGKKASNPATLWDIRRVNIFFCAFSKIKFSNKVSTHFSINSSSNNFGSVKVSKQKFF